MRRERAPFPSGCRRTSRPPSLSGGRARHDPGILRTGHRRPVLQLPTGAGKTRVAAEIILGSLRREGRAIFVVPRLSLIEQTLAAFEREGIWNVGVIQGAHFRTNPAAPVQIASAQTLARPDIPPASIIIIDECHLQFKSISEWIASPEWSETPFVGLSATPWSRGLGKSYDDLIMPVSIQQLIDEGWLSPFRVFAPPAPDLTGVRTTAGEFNEVDLSKAEGRPWSRIRPALKRRRRKLQAEEWTRRAEEEAREEAGRQMRRTKRLAKQDRRLAENALTATQHRFPLLRSLRSMAVIGDALRTTAAKARHETRCL